MPTEMFIAQSRTRIFLGTCLVPWKMPAFPLLYRDSSLGLRFAYVIVIQCLENLWASRLYSNLLFQFCVYLRLFGVPVMERFFGWYHLIGGLGFTWSTGCIYSGRYSRHLYQRLVHILRNWAAIICKLLSSSRYFYFPTFSLSSFLVFLLTEGGIFCRGRSEVSPTPLTLLVLIAAVSELGGNLFKILRPAPPVT